MRTWCELHSICCFLKQNACAKGCTCFGPHGFRAAHHWSWRIAYPTFDSFWLFKSCTILQFIFKGALLANTSIIILSLHRRLHQWLQSLFCCWISSINWSPFPPSVWNWTPWVQSFPMHFALPWLSVFQAMGREAKETYWMRLMRAARLHNIMYI